MEKVTVLGMKRIFEHLLFWLIYWIMISFLQGLYDSEFSRMFLSSLMHLPLSILSTYVFVYLILPFLYKKKILLFILFSFLLLSLSVILRRLSIQYIQFPLFYADNDFTFVFWDWYRIGGHFVQAIEIIGIVSGIKYFRDWNKNRTKIKALTEEKKDAELSFLKAQVHPHFFFNALNSIYYEVLKKSDKAADLVIQLSELFRYTLYECKDDFILLNKEIKIIENYIEIEKSRYGNRLKVKTLFEINDEAKIPPLILFSIIENSFKHGVSDKKGLSEVDISIITNHEKVILNVTNPYSKKLTNNSLGASDGIGLENTVKQLDIIYPSQYILEHTIKNHKYHCLLEIPIHRK